MRNDRPHCALGEMIPDHPDMEDRKRDAWNTLNTLVVKPDDPRLSAIERAIVNEIGAKLYGKGKRGA